MKNKNIGFALVFFLTLHNYTNAESSWWDKAVDIFKEKNKQQLITDIGIAKISESDIGKAFKEALSIGSQNVVKKLGNFDGFNNDLAIHIPLPKELETVKNIFNKIGLSKEVDKLVLKFNRAAENATPKAKELFLNAITSMSFEDIQKIYKGPNDSATTYFKSKMSYALGQEMKPMIKSSLSEVGAVNILNDILNKYKALPFVPKVDLDLTKYVVEKTTKGIFYYIAKEERAIRQNPLKQTTDLLKKVFGQK